MRHWLRRLGYLIQQSRHDAELREEIETHRLLRLADLERRGVPPSASDDESRRAMGNILLAHEDARETWLGLWDSWTQDLRYGIRALRRGPGAAILIIATIAVSIGMNAAIFGVFQAILLRPLPYPDAERLVWLAPHDTRFHQDTFASRGDFNIWRERAKSFEAMAAYGQVDVAFAHREVSEERVTLISEDFWSMTGAKPSLGRLFAPSEQNAVVLSHETFERRFGGNPSALGGAVTLNGYPVTIVGVLDRTYRVEFPAMIGDRMAETDAYIAMPAGAIQPGDWDRSIPGGRPASPWVRIVGKLRPHVEVARARTELEGVFEQLARDFPTPLRAGYTLTVGSLQDKIVAPVAMPLRVLLVAVALILLIATTNITNVLLARSLSRHGELAIRLSLGASWPRIMRQLAVESVLLAVIGCALGLAVARWALETLVRSWPHAVPRLEEAAIDGPVLVYAVAATLISTLLFGAGPVFAIAKTNLARALKREDHAASATRRTTHVRGLLVGVELAIATLLLIGAGLMLKSVWGMTSGPPGFEPERMLVTKVSLSGARYADRLPQEQYVAELLRRLETLPGVTAAGIDAGSLNTQVNVGAARDSQASTETFATLRPVSLGFLRALGVPLIRGTWPAEHALSSDAVESTGALLVNQRFAETVLAGQDPIGLHVRGGYVSGTIAGVVADFKDWRLDAAPLAQVYVPFKRAAFLRSVRVLLRTAADPTVVAPAVRDSIAQIDRTQAVAEFATLDDVLGASIANRRFTLNLLGLFAAVALFLALTGAYGVITHSVSQRQREIGIRIALGARSRDVVGLVLQHEMAAAIAGVMLGVLTAFTLAPLIADMLYDVTPRDVPTYAVVVVLLAAISLLTGWSAAARAANVDPVCALKGGN